MAVATACPHGAVAVADSDAVWVLVEEWVWDAAWAWDVDAAWHIRMLTAQVCLMHRMAHLLIMDGKEKGIGH